VRACRALSRWPQAGLAHDRRKTGSLSREPSSGQLQATHGGSTRAIRKSPALSKMSMKKNDMIGRPTIVHGDTTLRRRTTVRRDDMAGATTTTIRADERIPGKPAGMLRVTAPPPAGDFFLDSAVPRFLAQYPEFLWTCPSTRRLPTSRRDTGSSRDERSLLVGALALRDPWVQVLAASPPRRGSPASCAHRTCASSPWLPRGRRSRRPP
jgi:hypothetical protein